MAERARELHANPLTAPAMPKKRKNEIPLWKVWRWSLTHPNETPWKEEDDGDR